jgi:hypothetical protein
MSRTLLPPIPTQSKRRALRLGAVRGKIETDLDCDFHIGRRTCPEVRP